MDYSLPGSSIHGIFQARILQWVAISFSRRSSWPRDWTRVSHTVGRRFTVWATKEVNEAEVDFFPWNSLAFPVIQLMLAIGSLVPLECQDEWDLISLWKAHWWILIMRSSRTHSKEGEERASEKKQHILRSLPEDQVWKGAGGCTLISHVWCVLLMPYSHSGFISSHGYPQAPEPTIGQS